MNIQKSVSIRVVKNVLALMVMTSLASCGGGYGGSGGYGSGGSGGGGTYKMPTVAFSSPASATKINLGQTVKLTWTANYATSCTASTSTTSAGTFAGSQAASGSAVVAPTAAGDVTYTLTCTGSGGTGSATTAVVTVNPSILSTLATITTIGSTLDPTELGGNPYGLAIAPVTAGLITAGDLVVCNFNDGATNTQGLGTTIVGLHPVAGATPYRIAQSAQLKGCGALAILPDDSIAESAFSANLVPLVSATGALSSPFAADPFGNPWGQTYAAANGSAALYVSNQTNGAIDRISLNGDVQSGLTEIAKGFCGSGAPGGVIAPAGLTYDPSIDTLYIVDTSSNSVVAFSSVSSIGADGILVIGNCGATPAAAPTFSGPSASLARIIATGGKLSAPISAALLMDGNLIVSNSDIFGPPTNNLLFEISPAIGFVGNPVQLDTGAAGALFGLAATTDASGNQLIYFNDDNDNTVKKLSK